MAGFVPLVPGGFSPRTTRNLLKALASPVSRATRSCSGRRAPAPRNEDSSLRLLLGWSGLVGGRLASVVVAGARRRVLAGRRGRPNEPQAAREQRVRRVIDSFTGDRWALLPGPGPPRSPRTGLPKSPAADLSPWGFTSWSPARLGTACTTRFPGLLLPYMLLCTSGGRPRSVLLLRDRASPCPR